MNKKITYILLVMVLIFSFIGCTSESLPDTIPEVELPAIQPSVTESPNKSEENNAIDKSGEYTIPEDVALYIYTYGELPSNFITKGEAMDLGWQANKGNLWDVTDNKSIGGDKFGNREGLLPKAEGRIWYECDVNYEGGYRGEERIVFSNDGLIYYTKDHYESFEQLY